MRRLLLLSMCLIGLFSMQAAFGRTVQGTVYDAKDQSPLLGVSVVPVGKGSGTITDTNGKFKLEVSDAVKQITFRFVGMETVTLPVQNNMVVEMKESTETLDDLVVVAYGTQKKSSITGAISTVNASEIAKRPVSSVVSALEGSTPGITVTGNYGSPGDSPTILIRGIGTVNGSTSPLYVVDGVPFGGNITDINPEDVESLSVLKDAASAALYGNRASNGVILITTKRHKGQKINLNFKVNQGWYERALPEYDRTDVAQFMQAEYMNMANAFLQNQDGAVARSDKQAIFNEVTSKIFADRLYANYFNKRTAAELFTLDGKLVEGAAILPEVAGDLDWFGQATRNGYRQEYTMNGAGSSQKSDYFFSVGYLGEDGYMKMNSFDRLSGRVSVNITPTKWMRTGLNVAATHQTYQNLGSGAGDGNSAFNNPFYYCRYMAPIYPVHQHYIENATYYDASGKPYTVKAGQYVLGSDGKPVYDNGYYNVYDKNGAALQETTRNQNQDRHVILENELDKRNTTRNTMNAIGYMDFMLPFGVTASIKGNLNTRNSVTMNYGSAQIGDSKGRGGSLNQTAYNYKNWTLQEQLNWNKTFGLHNIQVLAGHENYSNEYLYTYIVKDKEAFAGLAAFDNFSVMNSIDGANYVYRTESYLGRIMYNFNDTYNLEASVRRDASSRFNKNVRWGTFGSVGANWIFTNEEFMKPTASWLNSGKLRADWGQVGNDDGSGYYAYYALFSADTNNSLPAYYLSQNPADKLKWETSESWGIALETRLFNRWNLTLEYFDKRNKDLIFNVYAPLSSGATSTDNAESTTTMNLGTISNRGIEINTDFDIYRSRDWKVNISANLTTATNKVVTLPEQNKRWSTIAEIPSMQPPRGIANGSQFISEGMSRYEWYLPHFAGVDQMNGRSLYDADLVKYHIVKADGSIYGGSYKCTTDGKLELDESGNKIRTSTALDPSNYVEINGKYYVYQTTYAEKRWAGSALPNMYGSFGANVSWKGLTLSALFTYSVGGKIYEGNYSSLMGAGQSPSNHHVDVLKSWNGIPEGMTETSPNRLDPNGIPEYNYLRNSDNNASSDRWLISRNYFCFKNLNLTYTLPKTWVRTLDLSNVQVSVATENLGIWGARKGMNPMMGIAGGQSNYMVPARVVTFGLNVNI